MGNYKMTNKLLAILTFLGLTASTHSQSIRNDYYPLDPKLRPNYYLDNFGDTTYFNIQQTLKKLNGHLYTVEQERRIHKLGEMLIHEYYYRLDSGNVYVTQDGQKNETLFLSLVPLIGQSWYLSDKGWQWKVVSINDTFTAAEVKFHDLLKIQEFDLEIPEDTATYFSYFKKGIGLIARTRNGIIERQYVGRK